MRADGLRWSWVWLALSACVHLRHSEAQQPPPAREPALRSYPLPGAHGTLAVDAMLLDDEGMRIWVPAGSSGNVDVIELATGQVQPIGGFQVVNLFGPSSVTEGNGVVFIGNRGSQEVCIIDPLTLDRGGCTALPHRPDGIAFVASTDELWAISSDDHLIQVLDATEPAHLALKETIPLDGEPQGVAVDPQRGLFYTTLYDLDRVLVFDAWQHRLASDFSGGCAGDGPRALTVDTQRQLAMVACASSVSVVDLAHAGMLLSHEAAGADLARLAYSPRLHRVFAGAGKDGSLTEFALTDAGKLVRVRTLPTARGAKVVVADPDGNAFVADPNTARVIEIGASR